MNHIHAYIHMNYTLKELFYNFKALPRSANANKIAYYVYKRLSLVFSATVQDKYSLATKKSRHTCNSMKILELNK